MSQEIPPWLREQLTRLDSLQQNLQSVTMQKQQIEAELAEAEKTLEELVKVAEGEQIYKYVGSLLVKVSKEEITKELEEKKDISNTRNLVLNKQQGRLKDNIKELQVKIDDMIKGRTQGAQQGPQS
ncbi:MAG: prefoldin subunit beta [Thaumarchaeota archaeon]|nr:prefoldin subunit beta [Nitrososphaerota archaeon]